MKAYCSFSTETIMFLLLQFFFLRASSFTDAAIRNIDTDRSALLAFKFQLSLDPSHVLSHNWSESFPVCSWYGVQCDSRHKRVTALNISNMGLDGNIAPQLGNLSFLVSLSLSFNNFQGSLPRELTQLRRLRYLELVQNNISGELPSWLGSFQNLRRLYLSNNTFMGIVPPSLSNLSNLEMLSLAFNLLQGGIPQELGYLQNLQILELQGNNLTGPIPVALFTIRELRGLALSFNRLQGPIPKELGNLSLLEQLNLAHNELTGEIPSSLLNISTLNWLMLSTNELSGDLSSNFGQSLHYMEALDLARNKFTSESPELCFLKSLTNCRSLRMLDISENPLNARFPSSIGNLSASLERLYAYNCSLYGTIPQEIGNLSNLIALSLRDNQLTGSLPKTLGNLQSLQGVDFQRNRIDGSIPSTLCNLLNLYGLALNFNQIGGDIPDCIGNLTSLRILQMDTNKLSSTIPASLWLLKDLQFLNLSVNFLAGPLMPQIENLRAAVLIDLSINQLSGIIPSTIGSLDTLTSFFLDYNEFQGPIPDSVAQIVSLEDFGLSNNNLSGPIPVSLEKLPNLVYFNVSFNDLSGEIPSAGPFQNFTNQSFLSNKGLCGNPKYNVPPCPHYNAKKSNGKNKFLAVFLSLGASAIVLALVIACVFVKYNSKVGIPLTSFDWYVPTPMRFSYYELMKATNGCDESNLLGRGSFGSVYRATLRNGKDVAVKVFNLQSESASNSFEVECEILRKLRHKNLSKVIGSCCSQDFRALVLEYQPNGSLEKWLYSHNYFLDITQRINVMIDIASAVEYLHYGYSTSIIHCDLKPSNILLDEDMAGHLCDFGITKLLDDGESVVRTMTLATLGYIAPEFGLEGLVSKRCDVYSYGIVLMEAFTRMSPNDEAFVGNLNLRSWVKDHMPSGIMDIVDSNLLKSDEQFFREKLNCLLSLFELALCCSTESPGERISIKDVRVALEKIRHQLHSTTSQRS